MLFSNSLKKDIVGTVEHSRQTLHIIISPTVPVDEIVHNRLYSIKQTRNPLNCSQKICTLRSLLYSKMAIICKQKEKKETGITFMLSSIRFNFNRIPDKTYVVHQWAGNMNCLESKAKNYLYTTDKDADHIQDFFQIAVSLVKNEKVVFVITRKHVDFLPLLVGLSKEQMQRILVSYNSDVNSIIDKLLELHDWTIMPDLVILNLNSFFDNVDVVPTFKKVCFCVSTLFHYMRSLEKQIVARSNDYSRVPTSITLLNSHPDVRIELLVDFYFYKSAKFTELDLIKQEISVQC